MNDHLRGIVLGVRAWDFFLVAGLPDYYRQYPAAIMLAAVALSIVPLAIAMRMMVRIMRRGSPGRRAAWPPAVGRIRRARAPA